MDMPTNLRKRVLDEFCKFTDVKYLIPELICIIIEEHLGGKLWVFYSPNFMKNEYKILRNQILKKKMFFVSTAWCYKVYR